MVLSDGGPDRDDPVSATTALLAARSRRPVRPAPSPPRAFVVVPVAVTIPFHDRFLGIVRHPKPGVADVAAPTLPQPTGAVHALACPPP
jgi:hypothetical protein